MIETVDDTSIEPLKPHSYHISIYIIGSLLFIGVAYFSIAFLPEYRHLTLILREADQQLQKKNYENAIKIYENVWGKIKRNKARALKVSEAYFGAKNDKKALKILKNISLNKSDWKQLNTFMPKEYKPLFKTI